MHLERNFSEDDVLGYVARLFCGLALGINRRYSESSYSPFEYLDFEVASVYALHCCNIAIREALFPIPAPKLHVICSPFESLFCLPASPSGKEKKPARKGVISHVDWSTSQTA